MDKLYSRIYLPLLIETLRREEEEIEAMELILTEENFDEFFLQYFDMQRNLSSIHREIDRVARTLGMGRKAIRKIITQE